MKPWLSYQRPHPAATMATTASPPEDLPEVPQGALVRHRWFLQMGDPQVTIGFNRFQYNRYGSILALGWFGGTPMDWTPPRQRLALHISSLLTRISRFLLSFTTPWGIFFSLWMDISMGYRWGVSPIHGFCSGNMMTTPDLKGDVNKKWGKIPQVVAIVQRL